MKTRSRILMASGVIVCALFGGTAIAAVNSAGKPATSVYSGRPVAPEIQVQVRQLENSQIIRLIIDNPEGRRITVALSDLSGTLINRVISGKNEREVVRDFNFSSAEDGIYHLEIYDGHNSVKKEIQLKRIPQPDLTQLSIH
jgi:hypothetical protein